MKPMHTFSLRAAVRAARAALQWRLLLLWVAAMLIPTAMLGLTMWKLLAANLDYSVHAADIAGQMDLTVLSDLLGAHGQNAMAFNSAAVLALITTLLAAPLLSGAATTAARAGQVLGLRALLAGGLAEYPRMLRMMLWSVVPLGLAAAVGGMAMGGAEEYAGKAILESDASLAFKLALAGAALLVALAHATLDAGRAHLALDRRRASAIKAWWSGVKLLKRHPLTGFGSYLLISGAGLALTAGLVVARINVAGANLAGFVGALLLVQLSVVVIGWMRSARLFALLDLARCERG